MTMKLGDLVRIKIMPLLVWEIIDLDDKGYYTISRDQESNKTWRADELELVESSSVIKPAPIFELFYDSEQTF